MTQFKAALSAPARYFKRLKQAEPVLNNGSVIVRRTHSMVESEILISGQRYLVFLPIYPEKDIPRIENLERIARERSRGPLLENHILYEELTMFDFAGNRHLFDVIIQAYPAGTMLVDAVNRYRADDLRVAIQKMKSRIDNIGFCHNNLNPSNVVICDSGDACPLRYWYAEWEPFSNNDISQLLELIDRNSNSEIDDKLPRLLVEDSQAEYIATPTIKQDGIVCRCKGRRYGFVDADGRKITDYIYSSPSEFCEGRAIVTKNNKMGVIDTNGRSVIQIVYESIEFDVETSMFTAINDSHCHIFDYNGKRVSKTRRSEIGRKG